MTLIEKNSQKLYEYIALAEGHFNTKFAFNEIRYDLKGRTAGQLVYSRRCFKSSCYFRFNFDLLESYGSLFSQEVVPHECAHLVAYSVYGRAIKPHGLEWRSVMEEVFGVEPKATHRFMTMPARKINYFAYLCACDEKIHQLSSIRHNRVVRGTKYLCKGCGSPLNIKR